MGSSPLARGLRPNPPSRAPNRRIIPARAGFTACHSWTWSFQPDHPRSRGVYDRTLQCMFPHLGSSPLARGLLNYGLNSGPNTGIIPARAGFTSRPARRACLRRDHPRSRGVYSKMVEQANADAGSSPLARGLPAPHRSATPRSGIIPARAGFTRFSRSTSSAMRDHPRSRGVYEPQGKQ